MMKKTILFTFLILSLILITGCGKDGGVVVDTEEVTENVVKIPLSEISEDVEFYTYNDSGVDINYFIVLGSDGIPRTAFDACDICGGYKGYEQKGSDIYCKNCGKFFSIEGLGTKNKGYGCWPSYLHHKIEEENIIIEISDLKSNKYRFT